LLMSGRHAKKTGWLSARKKKLETSTQPVYTMHPPFLGLVEGARVAYARTSRQWLTEMTSLTRRLTTVHVDLPRLSPALGPPQASIPT
jgi:hypothetical protein